jgi:protein-S-isoprenylcysteine O-methyltransferase Ste14
MPQDGGRQVNAGAFFVRWRVRLGYPLAIAVLLFARPTLRSILCGAVVGAVGLWLRSFAAGYLHKQEILTVTGPYAYTRNPLYLGSAILALGTALATHSWISATILFAYFALFYSVVMRREEKELQLRHGTAFEEYARTVPLFIPRFTAVKLPEVSAGAFSLAQYKKNHEWQAAVGFLLLLIVLSVIWAFRSH